MTSTDRRGEKQKQKKKKRVLPCWGPFPPLREPPEMVPLDLTGRVFHSVTKKKIVTKRLESESTAQDAEEPSEMRT